jgi:methyltransferase
VTGLSFTGAELTGADIILGLVTTQRVAELVVSHRNTSKLIARGAVEVAPRHYPMMVAVHGLWLIALWTFGHDQPVNVTALLAYLMLQGLRFWVMGTLGARWTTRIIVLPKEPLVTAGPYRYLAHPNYAVVAGEIATLPLVLGLPWIAVLFTILNATVLLVRIRAENRALEPSRSVTVRAVP